MGSERFYEKEMVSESDASYNSLSPDGSLTLAGWFPQAKKFISVGCVVFAGKVG